MFNKDSDQEMVVKETQYRAVISYDNHKRAWRASVQERIAINEWRKVRCGLKGLLFASASQAEETARQKMAEQRQLDKDKLDPNTYIIYDDQA
jgi:hypothetical protein